MGLIGMLVGMGLGHLEFGRPTTQKTFGTTTLKMLARQFGTFINRLEFLKHGKVNLPFLRTVTMQTVAYFCPLFNARLCKDKPKVASQRQTKPLPYSPK